MHIEGDAVIQPSPASTAARLRAARGEEGLTTLEWLLIVAAVAGLAVVAVVIVTRVVNQTADQLASSNPTVAAAQESARTLVEQANAVGTDPNDRDMDWADDFDSRCKRLRLSFGSAIEVESVAGSIGTGTPSFVGHALEPNDGATAGSFSNADSWLEGGSAEPTANQHTTNSSHFGCYVRQAPTS
ncbi:MAG: hypothetical protein OXH86_00680 [Acidimicrobiaceae bacterium]|nr:hypothetical protein [Acidimicrobiaceae bacterium]